MATKASGKSVKGTKSAASKGSKPAGTNKKKAAPARAAAKAAKPKSAAAPAKGAAKADGGGGARVAQLEKELAAERAASANARGELEALRKSAGDLDQLRTDARRAVRSDGELNEARAQVERFKVRVSALQSEADQAKAEVKRLQGTLGQRDDALGRLRDGPVRPGAGVAGGKPPGGGSGGKPSGGASAARGPAADLPSEDGWGGAKSLDDGDEAAADGEGDDDDDDDEEEVVDRD